MQMKKYYKIDEWSVIEEGFDPHRQEASESIFSLGNGHMGQRANFEEKYSGETLQGTYIAGLYYPDKTRVGWWKNGYPEYFAKVANAPNWIGISVRTDNEELDLKTCKVTEFRRELNMKHGYLERSFIAYLKSGRQIKVNSRRFLSMAENEIGAIRYTVKALNFTGILEMIPYIDGNIFNRDANYDEKFWDVLETGWIKDKAYLKAQIRKTGFQVSMTMDCEVDINGSVSKIKMDPFEKPGFIGLKIQIHVNPNDEVVLYKYVSVLNSLNNKTEALIEKGIQTLSRASKKTFDVLFAEHVAHWDEPARQFTGQFLPDHLESFFGKGGV